eukprot:CAMPEP_0170455534 /NCGR_PEP_ID=MMETSP0123-20130129/3470_1 /TAXON_ID=182087 /ORGANISM="Favella ehrenbergii, Strain Fehren 1" /LENGTH=112 /DNA_ID=CAMNT_0010718711 /DNA_START=319 /DNA_END=656 /DNA_ORIENTATION=+
MGTFLPDTSSELRTNKHDVVLSLNRALFFKNLYVLFHLIETLLVGEIEDYDGALTISEVAPSQREELLLTLSVPDLESDGLVLYLERQAFQVHSDSVHLALQIEVVVDEPDE